MSANLVKFLVGGREIEIDLGVGGPSGHMRYRLGGEWQDAHVKWDDAGIAIALAGEVTEFDLLAEEGSQWSTRRRSSSRVSGAQLVQRAGEALLGKGAAGRARVTKVKAQMPGKIIRVLVEVGAVVEAGASIVVMEAMKMENEIRAPIAGCVQSVAVAVGATVETGAELLMIAPVKHE